MSIQNENRTKYENVCELYPIKPTNMHNFISFEDLKQKSIIARTFRQSREESLRRLNTQCKQNYIRIYDNKHQIASFRRSALNRAAAETDDSRINRVSSGVQW